MKVGIFFGGQSREREISFAGGRTVYDNLDKSLFEPVPVFVDSLGNFILLDWEYIYKGTIRDFYPPVSHIPNSTNHFQIYVESLLNYLDEVKLTSLMKEVGTPLQAEDFKKHFSFAFLALHGPYGEDGNIQGLLEWHGIPYSGSGILPSAIGIDKAAQSSLLKSLGFNQPAFRIIHDRQWDKTEDKKALFESIKSDLGLPFVVKASRQGSSIGVSVVNEDSLDLFEKAMRKSFFSELITADIWTTMGKERKKSFVAELIDIRSGIGLPVFMRSGTNEQSVYHPDQLIKRLDEHFENSKEDVLLESFDCEHTVVVESFIHGREFSCIVIQNDNGLPMALPPTEIVKKNDFFDYRGKYLPGITRKLTPIDLPETDIDNIRKECENLFTAMFCSVYARIDGFITADGQVLLNDPNTTSGMMPSSFFFHQAAEIGMNPSQFLTYIIRTSISERLKTGKRSYALKKMLETLDKGVEALHTGQKTKTKVAVIMGGFSTERHISVESGRNIYEKLSSSAKYEAFPVFLGGTPEKHELYLIPVNILLKDNADDIKDKIAKAGEAKHPVMKKIVDEAAGISKKYAGQAIMSPRLISYTELSQTVDFVFIALHGRPGEDGDMQRKLEAVGLPYNGSGPESSGITINKFETNETLSLNGFRVAKHALMSETEWLKSNEAFFKALEDKFPYPFIAKPVDDGCSSAVKVIKNRFQLVAFASLIFRKAEMEAVLPEEECRILGLKPNEEFPIKKQFLVEELITQKGAHRFLEVTGGLFTKNEGGKRVYEVFEPSETLAAEGILSLEEKFLAGEGQNITPARFSNDRNENRMVSREVRKTFKSVAETLDIEGYARIDAFVRVYEEGVETIIIEINSLPGMTPATCIFHQAALGRFKPYDFIHKIIEYGMGKKTGFKA